MKVKYGDRNSLRLKLVISYCLTGKVLLFTNQNCKVSNIICSVNILIKEIEVTWYISSLYSYALDGFNLYFKPDVQALIVNLIYNSSLQAISA